MLNSVNLRRVLVDALSPLVADLETSHGRTIPSDSAALQLLVGYIGVIDEMDAVATAEVEQHVVTHILDLMALAIGATRDAEAIAKSRSARAAWLRAIKADIVTRLDQPDLSLATIAARHRMKPTF